MHVKELVIPEHIESASAKQVLEWSLETFQPRIGLCTSFAAEGVVLIDMLTKLTSRVRVFTLDTGRLMPETYAVIEAIRERYDLEIEVFFPRTEAVEAMTREEGVNLFYRSVEARKRCCAVRKVEPLQRALAGLDAWIAGLRRDQAETRTTVGKVEIDEAHGGIVKINPSRTGPGRRSGPISARTTSRTTRSTTWDIRASAAPRARGRWHPARTSGPAAGGGRRDRAATECGLHPRREHASVPGTTGS
jgi:phosphoadenylyl-sulfate reductase (thioredoxin)